MEAIKGAVYIRTSTQEQQPALQYEEIIRTFPECQGMPVFRDQQSAWRDLKERKEWDGLLSKLKRGGFSHVYCWDWDRLYRDRNRLLALFALCKARNVQVHSVRQRFMEQLHTIPQPFRDMMQDLFLQLLGWMAEEESTKRSQRVRLAVRHQNDGGPALSYKGKKWGRKTLSTRTKNKVIQLWKEGLSMKAITEQVTYDSRRGTKNISRGAVHKIITLYVKEKHPETDVQKLVNK